MDFMKDVAIDENSLDIEWLQQASLTMEYARHQAHCQRLLNKKKEQINVKKAELDRDIRTNPDNYDLDKVTESAIQAAIITNKEYQQLQAEYIELNYDYEMAFSAVQALQSKKVALENLVKLHGQQYFAGPKLPRDISKEWMEKQRTDRDNSKIRINQIQAENRMMRSNRKEGT